MNAIDTGSVRHSGCGPGDVSSTKGTAGFGGTPQQRADYLVRATVLGDLTQSSGHKGAASGVQGIATAIRKVLSKSDVAGTDVPDDVLKKIETSLKKAAQALADRGYDARTIDATIDKFRSQLADALDSTGGDTGPTAPASPAPTPAPSTPPGNDVTTVQKFVSREVQKQKTSLDITTAEGDQVSIRFRTRQVSSASVTTFQKTDGTAAIAAGTSVISRGQLQVEVNGDLNDDELAAIGDLLTKVNDIATKFFSGDVQAAFSAATELGVDSDQIASYQLDLTYSRRIAAAAYSSTRTSGTSQLPSTGAQSSTAGDASGSDGTSAASSDTATGSVAGTGSAASPPGASATPATNAATTTASTPSATDSTEGNPAPSTAPAGSTPATAQKTIVDFIGDVLSKLGSVDGAGRLSFSMKWKLDVLMTGLATLQPVTETPASSGTNAGTGTSASGATSGTAPASGSSAPATITTAKNTALLGEALQKVAA
jgi:hypothetical protein